MNGLNKKNMRKNPMKTFKITRKNGEWCFKKVTIKKKKK